MSSRPAPASSSTSEIARATARGSPARSRSATLISEQLSGNDEPLDLARALSDGRELDVAEVLLGDVILHEPVAAVDLHAVLGNAHGNLARVQLGHRGFERGPLSLV